MEKVVCRVTHTRCPCLQIVDCCFLFFFFHFYFDLKVVAEDADGPSYNHVRYSIVEGNNGSPFTIDPVRGELKVARQLDRERVSKTTDTALTVHSLIL